MTGRVAPPAGGVQRRSPASRRSPSWLLLCALHGVASMLLWWAGENTLESFIWRADTWLTQPWTLWTSAWVHMNTPQLIVNQIGLGFLAAFAWVVRPTLACSMAWLLAWPLAQISLLWWPQIGYAAGLSGVLHAGAMVLAMQLVRQRIPIPKARRWGSLLGLGLVVKLLAEQGWSHPVVWDSANDISVVQAAHFTGAAWGLGLGGLMSWLVGRWDRRTARRNTASAAPSRQETVHP
jgi:hypothetical protein